MNDNIKIILQSGAIWAFITILILVSIPAWLLIEIPCIIIYYWMMFTE